MTKTLQTSKTPSSKHHESETTSFSDQCNAAKLLFARPPLLGSCTASCCRNFSFFGRPGAVQSERRFEGADLVYILHPALCWDFLVGYSGCHYVLLHVFFRGGTLGLVSYLHISDRKNLIERSDDLVDFHFMATSLLTSPLELFPPAGPLRHRFFSGRRETLQA